MTDYDDILDGDDANVEAAFRDLEHEAELERLRRATGTPSPTPGATSSPDDPLAGHKAALADDDDGADPTAPERYFIAVCPTSTCGAKNRVSLTRVRTGLPRCGACKNDLSTTKSRSAPEEPTP